MTDTITSLSAPAALTRLMPLYWAEVAIEMIVSVSASTSAWSFASESVSAPSAWTTFSWICFRKPATCSEAVRATPTIAEAEVSVSPSFL